MHFTNFTSKFHCALKLTWTITDTTLPFLNGFTPITEDRLSTDIDHKFTNSHSYLDCTPSLPISCEDTVRFLWLPTTWLTPTDVDGALILPLLWPADLPSLPCSQTDQGWSPLVLNFQTTSLCILHIIPQHFRQLQINPITRNFFPTPPLPSFIGDWSFHDTLVGSSLPPTLLPPQTLFPPMARFYPAAPNVISSTSVRPSLD